MPSCCILIVYSRLFLLHGRRDWSEERYSLRTIHGGWCTCGFLVFFLSYICNGLSAARIVVKSW
jgi:hypothetical protein